MRRLLLLLVTLLIAAPAAIAAKPPAYFVDESKLPFDAIPGMPSQRLWGVHNNAGYRIEVPDNWNGELVLWAHGYRGNGLELTVDDHPLRPLLLAYGFAWAASSYSKNAYDPAQGAKDTHALGQFFNGKFGRPSRTYITGASMGGHITAVMAEQWPNSYAGAMPICGVLGDYELFDYFLDFNVASQAVSGVGQQFPFYPPDYLGPKLFLTLGSFGWTGLNYPTTLTPAGESFKSLVELRSGGRRPIFEEGFQYWNSGGNFGFLFGLGVSIGDGTLPRHPGVAVDNTDVVYQFDTDSALTPAESTLNNIIQRVAADPQGRLNNGIANIAPTNGNLKIPMLTMHTLGDLFVPFLMEEIYARRVAAHGASSLLVQRAIRDVRHCGFTPNEFAQGFMDLVAWVEYGVKPAGDDVLDANAVAESTYGCTFTEPVADRGAGPFAPPLPSCSGP